jgi:uncharacterized RDD family membrane protein YckC
MQKLKKYKQQKQSSKIDEYALKSAKAKAFITDTFLLMMPLVYIVFYLILGGREEFRNNMLVGWIMIFIPLFIIQAIFLSTSGQTPGYKAYQIKLVDEGSGEKPSFLVALFRNILALLSFFTIFGWLMMFVRKDRKTLHDLLSNTAVYKTK